MATIPPMTVRISARRSVGGGASANTGGTDRKLVDVGLAIAGFGLEAERTEVMPDDPAEIITMIRIGTDIVIARAVDLELQIFDDHGTAADFDVPLAVARQCRRCKDRGGHRHSN
ncbi:hypothetical protein J4558_17195 [Leptolyngbya sp. 15MV]|nr:hypothetical protein J4558_17195 [Leptolyngbya sp. 15MV]